MFSACINLEENSLTHVIESSFFSKLLKMNDQIRKYMVDFTFQ